MCHSHSVRGILCTHIADDDYITWVSPCCTKSGFRNIIAGRIPDILPVVHGYTFKGFHIFSTGVSGHSDPVSASHRKDLRPTSCRWLFFPFRHHKPCNKNHQKHQLFQVSPNPLHSRCNWRFNTLCLFVPVKISISLTTLWWTMD